MSIQATRVLTVADPSHQVVVFMLGNGSAQVVITSPSTPDKPSTHEIPKPPKGQRIVVTRYPTGEVEVMYRAEVEV